MNKKPKQRSPEAKCEATARIEYRSRPGKTPHQVYAATVAEGLVGNAGAVHTWTTSRAQDPETGELAAPTIGALHQAIQDLAGTVRSGDLNTEADRLVAHNAALDAVFTRLVAMAFDNTELHKFETLLRMALRTQAQIRANVETLAEMKNPPVVFARQANVTSGPQQVNNGVPSPARNPEPGPSKLLGEHDARLDISPSTTATAGDQPMAPVGVLNRATHGRG